MPPPPGPLAPWLGACLSHRQPPLPGSLDKRRLQFPTHMYIYLYLSVCVCEPPAPDLSFQRVLMGRLAGRRKVCRQHAVLPGSGGEATVSCLLQPPEKGGEAPESWAGASTRGVDSPTGDASRPLPWPCLAAGSTTSRDAGRRFLLA